MSNRSRWARQDRRAVWPWPKAARDRQSKTLRIWGQAAYRMGRGRYTLIHNGKKPRA
jgi:hypothetical protein